ncbi:hypothetical protein AA0117_g13260 [Alternaria alternata]|uniref:Uncharacterized protein n=1 Tax=Alternaria alternata TaxID=5599 RepID=A0A4Q4MQG0_ALTAL|nr:hypothetical protein AA0117_g13260 [Alternaria alternata]
MVLYPLPKYISKTVLKKADPYEWSERDKRVSEVATTPTCLRCAQNVATGKKLCKKPEQKRCGHCVKGNRGGCFLVPGDMVGKLNRLYRLRVKYDTAVSNSNNPRISATVLGAGAKLARCQRQFNLELATRRRTAAHTGTPMGVPTQIPKTSADFLSLILVEQRRIAGALEQVVKHMAHSNGMAGEGDDTDDSDDPSTLGDDESQAGGSEGAGGSDSGSGGGEEDGTGGGGGEGVEGVKGDGN